jgi:phosphoglycerate dehydrogenase-like enzyme
MAQEPIRVIVAMDYSDEIMEMLRGVSPRLHIERHHPTVPDSAWAEAEVLYTLRSFPDPAQAPRLRWIQLHTAGVDHAIHQPIIRAEDVDVTTSSGVHAVHMGEYCLMMMMAFAYKLPEMLQLQSRAEWPRDQHKRFAPRELRGQTLGIIGYGAVGREVARQANALGMTVLATKRDLKHLTDSDSYAEPGTGDPEGTIPARIYPAEALASMVSECDFVVAIVPQIQGAPPIVNEHVLSHMKKNAVFINVARGGVVDEAALISALAARKIAGAALDVFTEEPLSAGSPLWNLDNVIISPHISGNNAHYHDKTAALFAENLRRYMEKQPLLNRLDRTRGY